MAADCYLCKSVFIEGFLYTLSGADVLISNIVSEHTVPLCYLISAWVDIATTSWTYEEGWFVTIIYLVAIKRITLSYYITT